MGLYLKQVYVRAQNGKWKLKSEEIEKAPHEVGRWVRSCELEEKSYSKEKSNYFTAPTRTGINQKVNKVVSYFNQGNEKVVRDLITTSNKLSKNKKIEYRKVQGVNSF